LVCDLLGLPNVLVSNASIFTPNAGLFGTAPSVSGLLMILYGSATTAAQEPSLTGTSYLSIGNLSLPLEGVWRFLVSGRDWSPYFFGGVRGLFVLAADEGSYWIVAERPSRGLLGPSENSSAFPVSSNGSFFPVAYFIGPTPPPTPSRAFVESAAPAISGPVAESFRPDSSDRHQESQLAETAAHAGSDPFTSSANLDASQLSGRSTLSTGSLVGIVFAAVGAVASVVGLIAWRYCSSGSKAADAGPAREAATSADPKADVREDLSDELMDEQFD
jgi:hypothetical protein